MPRALQLESDGYFLMEDDSSFILFEEDWNNEPGVGTAGWTPASDASGASWTPVSGNGSNGRTEEDGS